MFSKTLRTTIQYVRGIISMALIIAFVATSMSAGISGTTGQIAGTVTVAGTPLANVTVTAQSPTGRYQTKTNAQGYYTFLGVSPDTYTVSFLGAGYEPQTQQGISVFADAVNTVSVTLSKELKTIGRTTARSAGGAYQPSQTVDTYTVTSAQIDTVLGKKGATSETNLLIALPGASLDKSGYPVLRGGRENEEGFQFEGIDYTDAFTSQFTNSLSINGVGSLQLTPGSGDASVGNSGTGVINLIANKGTRPPFGTFELDAGYPAYNHYLRGEYGFATPNGRFSNYSSFIGTRQGFRYGPTGSDSTYTGAFYGNTNYASEDFVNNAIYKFGKDNSQQVQFFYQNQANEFAVGYGGFSNLNFKSNDPFYLANAEFYTGGYLRLFGLKAAGLTPSQIQSLITLNPYQQNATQKLNRAPINYHQPNETFKLQYSNNLDASTFLTAKFYKVGSVVTFDFPYDQTVTFGGSEFLALQGGSRTGFALDITRQLNSKNLLTVGGKYEFLHPVYSAPSGADGLVLNGGYLNNGFFGGPGGGEVFDFVPPVGQPGVPAALSACPIAIIGQTCGYLYGNYANGQAFFPNGVPQVPPVDEGTATNRNDFALYINDAFTASDKLKLNVGLRVDGSQLRLPTCNINTCLPTATGLYTAATAPSAALVGAPNPALDQFNYSNETRSPRIIQPRAGLSYQFTKNDSIRLTYGRSVEIPGLAFIDLTPQANVFRAFKGIPSYNSFTGASATYCGTTGDRACKDYADQLYWENSLNYNGTPIQPAKPATFSNFDGSYSHQFPKNVALKISPFYRRGYDGLAQVASPRIANGIVVTDPNTGQVQLNPPTTTNLGISRVTGVEFYLTKESNYGLSGQLSATYLNEFSNVIPNSGNEDFFPAIPTASLLLGNQYRVGFLSPLNISLAAAYKTRSGFKVNPIVYYNRGYPTGVGLYTATFVNGVPVNVPNTNLTNPAGAPSADRYVDPQNPGTFGKPNIAATRGTTEAASAGGFLSHPRATTNISFEFTPPVSNKQTFGVLISNLFNQYYSQPGLSGRYQIVANGIAGPKTGYSATAVAYPGIGIQPNYSAFVNGGQGPYVIAPNGSPRSFRFYYQLGF